MGISCAICVFQVINMWIFLTWSHMQHYLWICFLERVPSGFLHWCWEMLLNFNSWWWHLKTYDWCVCSVHTQTSEGTNKLIDWKFNNVDTWFECERVSDKLTAANLEYVSVFMWREREVWWWWGGPDKMEREVFEPKRFERRDQMNEARGDEDEWRQEQRGTIKKAESLQTWMTKQDVTAYQNDTSVFWSVARWVPNGPLPARLQWLSFNYFLSHTVYTRWP